MEQAGVLFLFFMQYLQRINTRNTQCSLFNLKLKETLIFSLFNIGYKIKQCFSIMCRCLRNKILQHCTVKQSYHEILGTSDIKLYNHNLLSQNLIYKRAQWLWSF